MAKKSGIRFWVEKTKIDIEVELTGLAASKTGASAVSLSTLCPVHQLPVKQPKTCEACRDQAIKDMAEHLADHALSQSELESQLASLFQAALVSKDAALKGYKTGGEVAVIAPADAEATAEVTKGLPDEVRVLRPIPQDLAGAWGLRDYLARLVQGSMSIVPSNEAADTRKVWACLHAYLTDRVGLAVVRQRGNSRLAFVTLAESGALLLFKVNLDRDAKSVPAYPVDELSRDEYDHLYAAGAAHAAQAWEGETPEKGLLAMLDKDVKRDAKEELVMASVENRVPIPKAEQTKPEKRVVSAFALV
ncbi:MAG: hypothetical protein QOE90_1734 [Thermoplasmata archaeon]|nr:hypothetical protein [Thermoplasmata archaeon]